VQKYDGRRGFTPLSVSQIKQIAGRAGRFGMQAAGEAPGGFVTTLKEQDLPILRKTMQIAVPPVLFARVSPHKQAMRGLRGYTPENATTETLYLAEMHSGLLPPHYRHCFPDALSTICSFLDGIGKFTIDDSFLFVISPFPWRDAEAIGAVGASYVAKYYEDMFVDIEEAVRRMPYFEALTTVEAVMRGEKVKRFNAARCLQGMETFHKVLMVYIWLSFRNSLAYPSHEAAMALKERLELGMHWCLEEVSLLQDSEHGRTPNKAPIQFLTKAQQRASKEKILPPTPALDPARK
jgi:ATP-dependent RNA helicase SUPV3L1/SUV3